MKKILVLLCLSGCFLSAQSYAFQTIFIVRHAEKVDESRDPQLSLKGKKRAIELAQHLRDAGIERIYATEFQRTQLTAMPLAELNKIAPQLYSSKELEKFVANLKNASGNSLVVGHSNTVPDLLKALGMVDVKPIADDEFDRLVIVNLANKLEPSFTIMRY